VEFHIYSVTNQYEICRLHYDIRAAIDRMRSSLQVCFRVQCIPARGIIKRTYVIKSGLPIYLLKESKQHSTQTVCYLASQWRFGFDVWW
jgi:hypothetical protein